MLVNINRLNLRERSHMTSAAEEGGFEMLTVADKGGGGVYAGDYCINLLL